tara:strand:- start:6581 stop:6889 length:309 start_codon:yes stop_codon:yes gene_type:complete
MNYSKELVIQLDGLGIDMSKGPELAKHQLDALYTETRYNTFGYLENLESFNKVFEPVYGLNFFILVRNVREKFLKELRVEPFKDLKKKAISITASEGDLPLV